MNGTEKQENGSSNGQHATARTKRVLSREFDRVAVVAATANGGSMPAKDMTSNGDGGVIHDGGEQYDDRENDSSSEAFASTKSDDDDDDAAGEEEETVESSSAPCVYDDGSVDLCPALIASSLIVAVAYLGSLHVVLVEAEEDLDSSSSSSSSTDDFVVVGAYYRHGALCLGGALLFMTVKSTLLVKIVLPALLPIVKVRGGGGFFGRLLCRVIKLVFGLAILGLLVLCDWVLVTECIDALNGEVMLK